MVTNAYLKKVQRAIEEYIEDQCELLREDGMTHEQELDLLAQLTESLADDMGELEHIIDDEGDEDIESDEPERDRDHDRGREI